MAYDPARQNKRETSVVPKPKVTVWQKIKEFLFVVFLIFAVRLVMLETGIRFGYFPVVDDILYLFKSAIVELQDIADFYF